MFGTTTKDDAKRMDISVLKAITAVSKLPVYAIGGINAANISRLAGSGIYGVAVVSGIFKGDIKSNAQKLAEAIERL